MKTKDIIPKCTIEKMAEDVISLVLAYKDILKTLPKEYYEIESILIEKGIPAQKTIEDLENYDLVSWHKKDGIVHRTKTLRIVEDLVERTISQLSPISQKIIMRKVNSDLKTR